MPLPDLSNIKAVIADDRPEIRDLLRTRLEEIGVTHIDAFGSQMAGGRLLALLTLPEAAPDAGDAPRIGADELVTRFSHDVASPLMCVLALSGLLVQERDGSARAQEDLRQIYKAAEEIAALVRTLGVNVALGRKPRDRSAS